MVNPPTPHPDPHPVEWNISSLIFTQARRRFDEKRVVFTRKAKEIVNAIYTLDANEYDHGYHSGFDSTRVVAECKTETIDDIRERLGQNELLCPICLNVAKRPIFLNCNNEHVYCAYCLSVEVRRQWLFCPNIADPLDSAHRRGEQEEAIAFKCLACMMNVDLRKTTSMEKGTLRSPSLKRAIKYIGLRVQCSHCQFKSNPERLYHHETFECDFRVVDCPFIHCKVRGSAAIMKLHIFMCRHQGTEFKRNDSYRRPRVPGLLKKLVPRFPFSRIWDELGLEASSPYYTERDLRRIHEYADGDEGLLTVQIELQGFEDNQILVVQQLVAMEQDEEEEQPENDENLPPIPLPSAIELAEFRSPMLGPVPPSMPDSLEFSTRINYVGLGMRLPA